jgi:hypothetical protein
MAVSRWLSACNHLAKFPNRSTRLDLVNLEAVGVRRSANTTPRVERTRGVATILCLHVRNRGLQSRGKIHVEQRSVQAMNRSDLLVRFAAGKSPVQIASFRAVLVSRLNGDVVLIGTGIFLLRTTMLNIVVHAEGTTAQGLVGCSFRLGGGRAASTNLGNAEDGLPPAILFGGQCWITEATCSESALGPTVFDGCNMPLNDVGRSVSIQLITRDLLGQPVKRRKRIETYRTSIRFWIEVTSTLLTEAKSKTIAFSVGRCVLSGSGLPLRGPGLFQGRSPGRGHESGLVRRVC